MKTITLKTIWFSVFILSLFIFSVNAWAEDVLIIANENVVPDQIGRKELAEIYQGLRVQWDNGEVIRVVMMKDGATHENFVENVIGISSAKLKNIWKKVIFTGTGTPPKIFRKEAELVQYISETQGAVGYIDPAIPHEGVKILSIK